MVIGLTGATGFLGRQVASGAAAAGHTVIAYSRSERAAVAGAREVRAWSTERPPDLRGCEAVVHLAGESVLGRWTPSKRAAILESRVDGTRAVVAAMRNAGVRVLVSASAIGYYGDRGDTEVDESDSGGLGFLAEVTAAWENEAMAAAVDGVRVVCTRFGLVLGREGGAWPMVRRGFSTGLGGRLGSGRQWMSWVHERDVVGLLLAAVADDRFRGPVNVVSPHPVTNSDFTRAVARVLHRPAVIPVPEAILRALLRDQASLFLDSQRVRPRAALTMGYRFAFGTLSEALAEVAAK